MDNNQTPHKSFFKSILFFILTGVILIVISGLIGYFLGKRQINVQSINQLTPTPFVSPTSVQTLTIDETENWKSYTSNNLGLSFKYPSEYKAPEENSNYISLISPLNPEPNKGYELQNGELKIEIYVSDATPNESLIDLVKKKKEQSDSLGANVKILEEKEILVDGIKAIKQTWEGMGSGQTILLINNNKEMGIIKYPAITSRDNEFDQILSTFKFLE